MDNDIKVKICSHCKTETKEAMTRENYGYYGWHIDHIKPCAAFDLNDPEQQKICFNYKNLQPMWRKENMRKSAYYEEYK